MSRLLRILPAADADVDAAATYIAQENLGAALRFFDAIDATYRDLRERPMRWPIYELRHRRLADVRKRSVIGFDNYLVFYRVENRAVEIVRVLHGARDIPSVLSEI